MSILARRVEIASDASPEAVLARLRRLVATWHGSTLAASALQAGIYGWAVDENPEGLVVRPRCRGRGAPVAMFDGSVQRSLSGSSISGQIRLHPAARLFLFAVVFMAAMVPVGALFDSVPPGDWHSHLVRAGKILPISALIATAGLLMMSGGLRMLGRHILALLRAAAAGEPGA